MQTICGCCSKKDTSKKDVVIVSIRIPATMIDEYAEKLGY
jgi:hypothetical protein